MTSFPFPLYYEKFGDSKNPCMILIMGLSGQLINWQKKFIDELVANQFYVVAFDNRDTGLSKTYDELDTPNLLEIIATMQQGKSFDPPYTLQDMTADVIALMDHLHVKQAHLVGISMGGIIGQLAAIHYPERVLSLTCIATTSGDPALPPTESIVLDFIFSPQRKSEDMTSYIKNKIDLYKIYNPCENIDEEKAGEFYTRVYKRGYNPGGFTRQLLAMMASQSRVEQLKQLKTPCLIIHGDHDPVFPLAHAEQLAKIIPHAHFEIIKNMGHSLSESLSEIIAKKIIRYLAKIFPS